MHDLIKKAEITHNLSKNEIIELLSKNEINEDIFNAANRVRKKYVGDEVHLRGLIEFSNICKRNCLYCGLRKDNKNIKRYRLEPETIIEFAKKAAEYGYKTIVLQSGEDSFYNVEKMREIISEIKKLKLAITLSIGEKSFEEYQEYKKAGADRYLIRIETTDKKLYEKMDPDMDFETRKKCLKDLKEIGFEVGTGCIVGLPEQTIESLAEDILFFKQIDADMIGIGPFIPNENTPLKDAGKDNFNLALKVMAITRLLLPDINIPATTAMETLNPNGSIIALESGANVVMPNVTEGEYKKLYQLYPGKSYIKETPERYRRYITKKITEIGRIVSNGFGYRIKVK